MKRIFLLIFLLLASPGWADTHYVCSTGSDSSPFTSWATASNDIQAAVTAASEGDTVEVCAGTYTGAGNRDITVANKTITLKSSSGASSTIIDAEGAAGVRVLYIYGQTTNDNNTIVDGFTIRNGNDASGSGIRVENTNGGSTVAPTIKNCILEYNYSSGVGSAIYLKGADADDTVAATIQNNIIRHNYAGTHGGAIYAAPFAPATITQNEIYNNTSAQEAAGIFHNSADLTVTRNEIYNNFGRDGAAIYMDGTSGLIAANLIYNNSGRIGVVGFIGGSDARLTNTVLYANEGRTNYDGIYSGASSPDIDNCILWKNGDEYYSTGGSPSVDYSDVEGLSGEGISGTGNIDSDPLFRSALTLDGDGAGTIEAFGALWSDPTFSTSVTDDLVTKNTDSFTRATAKTNFSSGSDTGSGTAQFETVYIASRLTKGGDELTRNGVDPELNWANGINKEGNVWGIYSDRVYELEVVTDPGDTQVAILKDFGSGTLDSLHVGPGGEVYVAWEDQIWRSPLGDGTDDWVQSLDFDNANIHADHWSWANDGSSKVWVAEYEDKSFTDGDDAATKIYLTTDQGVSWTEVFDLADYLGEIEEIHIHAIVWNPVTQALYIANGDATSGIYKLPGGTAGTATKITTASPADYLNRIQPTGGYTLSNGNILWADDNLINGFWLHDTSNDTFTIIPMIPEDEDGDENYENGGPYVNIGVYQHGNTVYFATYLTGTVTKDRTYLMAAPVSDLTEWKIIDYIIADNASATGFLMFAGYGGDGKIWVSATQNNVREMRWYNPVTFTQATGFRSDPAVTNLITDPFFDAGSGWADYTSTYVESTGGHYKDNFTYLKNTDAQESDKAVITDSDDLIFYFRVKRGSADDYGNDDVGPSVTFNWDDGGVANGSKTVIWDDSHLGSDWTPLLVKIPAGDIPANTDGVEVVVRGDTDIGANEYQQMDSVLLLQDTRIVLPQASRNADSLTYTLPNALVGNPTIIGTTHINYPLDSNDYALFEAYKDVDEWHKLVVNDNDLILKNNAGALVTCTDCLPTVIDEYLQGDTVYWAIRYDPDGDIYLYVATQRSYDDTNNDVYSANATASLQADMVTLYDGCSHTAGEEIGGIVLSREIYSAPLSLDQIKAIWDQTTETENFKLASGSPCINTGSDPFSDGDGNQYDLDGKLIWDDVLNSPVGNWSNGVEMGAYGYPAGNVRNWSGSKWGNSGWGSSAWNE